MTAIKNSHISTDTEHCHVMVSTCVSYTGSHKFESWPEDRYSWGFLCFTCPPGKCKDSSL